MLRHIHIDPGDDPAPGLVVKLHAVMAFLEQLHQFTGIGMELKRDEAVVVPFRPVAADVGMQGTITVFFMEEVGSPFLPLVATDTVLIEYRLYFAFETETARLTQPGCQLCRCLKGCHRTAA